ncbi:acylphosphatase [Dorcoceras hygrometricum]|uniref:acylphosphatase n=1 Tax=Dorcoceras hygrometricum TaxID=472368 RepID=A0A2Z7AW06_9LAMI|nr:acylphosphatase [Dorcoceras hygrometricum]
MANSVLKSRIVLRSKNLPDLTWPGLHNCNAAICRRRFPHSRVPLRSLHLHLLPPSLPFPRSFLLSPAPLLPLFRRRVPPVLSPISASMSFSEDKDAPTADPAAKTVRVMIKGRVQGVFYRNWTINNANALGLKGWVRNRRDGSVEALFSGKPDKVDEMEQRCRRGPPDAMVTGLQVFPSTDDPGTSFQRKPTA